MPYDRAQALLLERQLTEGLNQQAVDRAKMKNELARISGLTQKPPLDVTGTVINAADLDTVFAKVKTDVEALLNGTPGP